jgi:hypothetical protein
MHPAATSGEMRARYWVGWWVFTVLACAQFAIRYVWRNRPFLDLPNYANGLEKLPFQGRVLMAWVLKATAGDPHFSTIFGRVGPHLPVGIRDPYSIVLVIVDVLAMVLCVWVGRLTLEHLTGDKVFAAWASLLLLYMAYFDLIIGYALYMLPYDIVSLAIFVLSVWLVVTKRYAALTAVVAIGTLNRETVIFVPIFLGLYAWFSAQSKGFRGERPRDNRWLVATYIAAQILIWIALRAWIHHRFLHNPLDTTMSTRWFGIHLKQNLISLAKPPQWPLLLSVFGFTLPLFIAKFGKIQDRALAKATAVILVLWTAAMLFVGVIVEIRIFSELSAFMMPCIALILWDQWFEPARRDRLDIPTVQTTQTP